MALHPVSWRPANRLPQAALRVSAEARNNTALFRPPADPDMNMLLHGVKDTEFEIFHGDTPTNEWDTLRELNPAKKTGFAAITKRA